MNQKEAHKITGGIGFTTKTGMAYGLPSLLACHMGSKLAKIPGSACFGCYARKGRYAFSNVVNCQHRRLKTVKKLTSSIFQQTWIDAMVKLISSKNARLSEEHKGYFRWHDSGDLISSAHLEAIVEVVKRLPEIRFWLPTKELSLIKTWLRHNQIPKNLCIRISGFMIDQPAKTVRNLPVSNIHTEKPLGHECPAVNKHSSCGKVNCRKCWDKKVKTVSYGKH